MWLSDESGLNDARILIFGYAADFDTVVAPKRSAFGVTEAANQLLDGLDIFYSSFGYVSHLFLQSHSIAGSNNIFGSQHWGNRCQKGEHLTSFMVMCRLWSTLIMIVRMLEFLQV